MSNFDTSINMPNLSGMFIMPIIIFCLVFVAIIVIVVLAIVKASKKQGNNFENGSISEDYNGMQTVQQPEQTNNVQATVQKPQYCDYCGSKVAVGAKHCGSCGAKISK